MNAPLSNGSMNPSAARKIVSYTTTALKRWSCYSPRELPAISQIQALHVYDFDNTLFMSPLPNRKLWTGQTVGFLQSYDALVNGGWWHDERILEATGEGMDKEESKAWKGWWNEDIVELVEMSMKQEDALTVLLTGRAEHNFAEVIKRVVASKKLEFDMICLKPQAGPNNQRFTTTMKFKQAILEDLVHTYKEASWIRVYEDRPKHTQGFKDYFQSFNDMVTSPAAPTPRKRINAEIIQVADTVTTLDPVTETTEVQRMINGHNVAIRSENPMHLLPYEIKRQVFFTGYLLLPQDSTRLVDLIDIPRKAENGISFLANSILISARPVSASILKHVGGMGHKQKWQVTGIGNFQSKLWAARVAPVPAHSSIHTESPVPLIVLALSRDSRPQDANYIRDWRPVSKEDALILETTVGEKVQLRIEQEDSLDEYDRSNNDLKRPYGQENERSGKDRPYRTVRSGYNNNNTNNDENRRTSGQGNNRGAFQPRGRGNGPPTGPHRGRGGPGRAGGNRGGPNNRGRGRGYKSLDDIGSGNNRYDGNRDRGYNDGPGYSGNDGYKAAFPPLGGGDGAADGGLSY